MAEVTQVNPKVIQGYFHMYPKNWLKKKKRCYLVLISSSMNGIARLEIYKTEEQVSTLRPEFMIVGSDVVKVERILLSEKEGKDGFLISTRDSNFTFCIDSYEERDKWVKLIQETLIIDNQISVSCSKKEREKNDLYESVENFSSQSREFMVRVKENTRARLDAENEVKLVVEENAIVIISKAGKLLARWEFKEIRSFSHSSSFFSVFSGRNTCLGEGEFVFLSNQSNDIYEFLCEKRRLLKQKLESKQQRGQPPVAAVMPPYSRSVLASPSSPPANDIKRCSSSTTNSRHMVSETVSSRLAKQHPKPASEKSTHTYSEPQEINDAEASSHYSNLDFYQQKVSSSKGKQHPRASIEDTNIYSEPINIKDAWKSHGSDDTEDDGLYNSLDFYQQKKVESHYWHGSVDSVKEKKVEEDLYATVDISMKTKNRK